jgi:hypothetical protein
MLSVAEARPMSPVRIMALLGLALVLAAMAAATSPDDHVYAWLTGQCFRSPPPLICHRDRTGFSGRRYDI